MKNFTCWLIESREFKFPTWLEVIEGAEDWGWTNDANSAIMFSTEKSAKEVLALLLYPKYIDDDLLVTEHSWVEFVIDPEDF